MKEQSAVHTHVLEDGTVVHHSHGHHTHTHQNTKEVLIQLSAVKSAINNTGKVILQDHIEHCIVDAVQEGDTQALEELNKAIDRFMK